MLYYPVYFIFFRRTDTHRSGNAVAGAILGALKQQIPGFAINMLKQYFLLHSKNKNHDIAVGGRKASEIGFQHAPEIRSGL